MELLTRMMYEIVFEVSGLFGGFSRLVSMSGPVDGGKYE
jgi:hypothetical protein